ncbi:PAS domain-containing hybrid sensor histidine kinase/response regulator [Tropicibacter oceani]|uniref:histidine kinase n=1 Tax=Tropicibacter oceani TaxID=3058420 RepID=A0ABY8QN23_9RHOB|nr:PAS domain-containing hybrid sensor histidine kinase/response regulator [Tropicibacter oceani]WGW06026.1 PAS domain S-box protein [Tropicibacter oceani]
MPETARNLGFFHTLLEACVDAVIVSDRRGRILRTNPAAANLFGYSAEEMDGQPVDMLMPRAMARQHAGFMAHHLDTGDKRIIGTGRDVEGLRKNGSTFPLHLSVGRADIDGDTYFVAILHDLTRQRTAQRALERSQRLDAIGQMTGGIAHDFNNLLTVVIGNLELLEMRATDERLLGPVRDALASAELGANLIRQLMVFARQSHLRPVVADLGAVCSDTLAILRGTLGEPYVVKTLIGKDLHPVLIDTAQLQSALVNLALNARDAMPGRGELLIAIENVTIDDRYMAQETHVDIGDYLRISVSDNGLGMTPEVQQRVFEPFFTTKSGSGGTGLGLAMVYGFVRQSGGHVALYSEPGHGTTFSLYFPRHSGTAEAEADTPPSEQPALPPGRGETVLVVEDNPLVRSFAVARLRDLGYHTAEASSGDDAYEMLCSGLRADLLFSDLVMPGQMNGYDLAKRVRAEFPGLRVLLTSGYASDVAAAQDLFSGNSEILHKPYHHADLAHRIRALLDQDHNA